VWTFLNKARDPTIIVPNAIVVAGDPDAPAVVEVIDIVRKEAGDIVHLRIFFDVARFCSRRARSELLVFLWRMSAHWVVTLLSRCVHDRRKLLPLADSSTARSASELDSIAVEFRRPAPCALPPERELVLASLGFDAGGTGRSGTTIRGGSSVSNETTSMTKQYRPTMPVLIVGPARPHGIEEIVRRESPASAYAPPL
jgi:hypothetical protein